MPETAPSPESRPRRRNDKPLRYRLHFHAHMADLVRVVGYETLPRDVVRDRLRPLIETYGQNTMNEAAEELLHVDYDQSPEFVRLKDDVRRIAVQILGRPPAAESTAPDEQLAAVPAPPSDVQTPEKSARLSRKEVLPRFVEWLQAEGIPHAPFEMHRELSRGRFGTLDFTVERDGHDHLVTVRPKLSALQRRDMLAWPDLLNGGIPVRVWPAETGNGWEWQWHPVGDAA